jgi:uncharacterized FAD-dependent dehydrogenase
MKFWSVARGEMVENQKVEAFLKAIWKVCEKHGLALSHEDKNGAFEVVLVGHGSREWLMDCHDDTGQTTEENKEEQR